MLVKDRKLEREIQKNKNLVEESKKPVKVTSLNKERRKKKKEEDPNICGWEFKDDFYNGELRE